MVFALEDRFNQLIIIYRTMQENKDGLGLGENISGPDKTTEQYGIQDDSDTLEPFEDGSEHRRINADDPADLEHWAAQFQISEEELRAAIVLNGNSVKAITKYLSV